MQMGDLSEYGIGEGISEVIATTQSSSGEVNAAPVGIINRGELHIRLYNGSRTLSNVIETRKIAANVCDDPMIFAVSALSKLADEYFTRFHGFPVLRDADAWLIFTCYLEEKARDFFVFRLQPIAMHVNRRRVKSVNRGFNAIIEATILATRVEMMRENEKLREMMEHYKRIVEKCGGSREKEAMRFVLSVFQRRMR